LDWPHFLNRYRYCLPVASSWRLFLAAIMGNMPPGGKRSRFDLVCSAAKAMIPACSRREFQRNREAERQKN
jgi:hypothetical protein